MGKAKLCKKNITVMTESHAIVIIFSKAWFSKLSGNCLIKYRVSKEKTKTESIKVDKEETTLDNLRDDTEYEIKVYIEKKDGSEKACYTAMEKTKISRAKVLFGHSDSGIYSLKPKETTLMDNNVTVKYFEFDSSQFACTSNSSLLNYDGEQEKTIYLLGECSSGKTTLVNAMANHFLEVHFADSFRLKVTCDEMTIMPLEYSVTNTIWYKINPPKASRYKWILNIVDVKGFDSRVGDNNSTATEMRSVLQAAKKKSIYCLVIRSTCRFTDQETHMWKSIISAFPQTKRNSLIPLFTFCDGSKALAKEKMDLVNIPYKKDKCFYFNNAKMNNCDREDVDTWNQRNESLQQLLKLDYQTDENIACSHPSENQKQNKMQQYASSADETQATSGEKEIPYGQFTNSTNANELPKQDNLNGSPARRDIYRQTNVSDVMQQVLDALQDIKKEQKIMSELFESIFITKK